MSGGAGRVDGQETPHAAPGLVERRRDVTWDFLSERIHDLIIVADVEGRIFYASPAARDLGYEPYELVGMAGEDFVHPEDLAKFQANTASLFHPDGIDPHADREHRFRRKDGSWVWMEGRPTVLPGSGGQPAGILNVFRDVSDQRALKDRLREALAAAEHAAAVKAEFLANMSHEIRTPLTAVLGFSGLLSERRDLDAAAQGQIARIAGASRALLAVVNDVLDFSKLEAGEVTIRRRPMSAEQAGREVLEMFAPQAQAKGIELRFETAVDLPQSLLIDEDRLRQILINLVGNAVKFTDRGRVSLALSYDLEGRLVAEVRDTGPGIAGEAKAKLFQRFSQIDGSSTRTKGGSGLGLAICLGLAEAMGGAVRVTSRVGRGSSFRLVLPALRAMSDGPVGASSEGLDRLCGVRVLVVDDNMANRELARAILEPAGVEVSEARGGLEAVEIAQGLPLDAILMDLRMPDLDGRGALAAIRREPGPNQHMPILAFSADGTMHASAPEYAGFQGVVRKPISPADMLQALLLALDEEPDHGEQIDQEGTRHDAVS